jgi:integrase
LIEACTNCKIKGITPSLSGFKTIIKTKKDDPKQHSFILFIDEFILKSKKLPRTKLGYNSTKSALERYQKKRNILLSFNDINLEFYNDFKNFIDSELKTKNYFGTLIKHIKVFMDEAKEEGLHNSNQHRHKKFRTLSETADSIYLNETELLKIYKLEITDNKIIKAYKQKVPKNIDRIKTALEVVRNKFLIGAFTALRVSDFNRLQEINLKGNYIRINPTKGSSIRKNDEIVIPIHWIIKEILENGFDLSQKISDQKINKHIKTICEMAEIDEIITSYTTVGGILKKENKPKYKMVSSHTARRSGATNMFKAEIPPIRIMKITGHRTEKSFMKYIRITQEENAKSLSDHPFFKK